MSEHSQREQILQRALARENLPVLSPLAVRLVELAASDDTSAQDLARIIEMDAGLATRLLRLVNSPVYRRGNGEITSISRAVVLLGLREVRIMALSISLRDTLPIKKEGPDYHLYWRASLHRAVLARETARRLALDTLEEAFVAGLIQELGLPILLKALEPEQAQGFPGLGAALEQQLQWERRHLGLDHRELGREVMGAWGLPAILVACQEVVPEDSTGGEPLVLVADFACRATESFFQPDGVFTDIHRLARRRFDFDSETVNQVLATALNYVGEAAEALDIELDHGADLLEVMEKANHALSRLSRQVEPHLRHMMEGPEGPPGEEPDPERVREEAVVDTLEAVVHEIRNPLMSVGGFARRLADQIDSQDRARKYAEVIMSQAARLDSVLAEMISIVSPYTPNPQPLELGALLEEVLASLDQDPPRDLSLPELVYRPPREPVPVNADPQGMRDVMRLMIIYAAHLVRRTGSGDLRLDLEAKEGRAVFTLLGRGDPQAALGDELAGKSFGPELGLARARRILEAHGGSLTLKSSSQARGFLLRAVLA